MGYVTRSFYLILLIKSWEVTSITSRLEEQSVAVRNFRRHTGLLPPTEWESGLREAIHQAFLREHHHPLDPELHDKILSAPIIGRQDSATPFGDIAVLARGQIYQVPQGYQLVQDPYQNDCDDCHNPNSPKCLNPPCEPWLKSGPKRQLLALWTVKRLRHRDPNYGHVFELEYTISPVTAAIREGLLTRNGHYNYNVPGHVFVIKSDSKLNSAYYQHNNAEKHGKINEWYHDTNRGGYDSKSPGFFKPGIVVGVTPDGYKQVLHSFPGFFSSYQPTMTYTQNPTTVDPKEYELYKKLIESLAHQTTHGGHRFSPPATTQPTYSSPKTTTTTTTEFVRLSDGQLYPITTTTKLPEQIPVRFPTTQFEDIFGPPPPPTTSFTLPQFTTTTEMRYPVYQHETSPKPLTTVHYFTPVEETASDSTVGSTSSTSRKTTVPALSTKKTTSKLPSTVAMTKLTKSTTRATSSKPAKTTIYKKPTTTRFKFPTTQRKPVTESSSSEEEFDLFPESKNTKPTSAATTRTTTKKSTTPMSLSEESDDSNQGQFFPMNTPTEPMTTVMTSSPSPSPKPQYPESINEQLPSPDNGTDTTVPYVTSSSTVTRAIDKEITQTEPSTLVHYSTQTGISETTSTHSTSTKKEPVITTTTKDVYTITTDDIRKSTRPETTQPESTTRMVTSQPESTMQSESTTRIETTPALSRTEESTTLREFTNTHAGSTRPATIPDGTGTPTTDEVGTTFFTGLPGDFGTTTVMTTPKPPGTSRSTEKYRRTKPPTTTPLVDDFLADSSGNDRPIVDNRKDYSDDDIFGTDTRPRKPPKSPKPPVKKVTQSDLEIALFGGNRRAKQIILSSVSPRTTTPESGNTTKIIYSNFFVAPTEVSTLPRLYDESLRLEPTIMAKITEIIHNHGDYKIYKAELPDDVSTTPTYSKADETKKVFDDFAWQLVNHARSINYLNKKMSRRPKYKRRSYPPKTQRRGGRISTRSPKKPPAHVSR